MFNDAIDDQPHHQLCAGFEGVDMTTPPALLPPGLLSDGCNIICDGDGLAKNRPGLRLNSFLTTSAYGANPIVRGLAYYDLPGSEFLVAYHDDKIWSVPSASYNATPTYQFAVGGGGTAPAETVQLIDTLYTLHNGVLRWILYSGGIWTTGLVSTFSDASPMPVWSRIASQGFRLLLLEADGYKLYASAIGAAATAANWVITENIRVGDGSGDPGRGLVANQGGYVTMLNALSVYQINMQAAAVADWTSLRVTAATGCVEGRTAVAFGQEIYFLARQGVVALGSLSDTISISPSSTLSAPIKSIIDRINWTYIQQAFATSWREFYLLALPLDSNTLPQYIVAYHTRLKRWMPLWQFTSASPATQYGGPTTTYVGLCAAEVVNFGDKAETVLADNCGRILRLDDTTVTDQFITTSVTLPEVWLATRAMEHDASDSLKQPLVVEVEQVNALSTTVKVGLLPDGTSPMTSYSAGGWPTVLLGSSYAPAAGVDQTRFSTRNRARFRQVVIQVASSNQAGGLRVRAVKNSAFLDVPQLDAAL